MIGEVRVNLNDDEDGVVDGYVSGDDVNFDADDIETNHKNGDDDGVILGFSPSIFEASLKRGIVFIGSFFPGV